MKIDIKIGADGDITAAAIDKIDAIERNIALFLWYEFVYERLSDFQVASVNRFTGEIAYLSVESPYAVQHKLFPEWMQLVVHRPVLKNTNVFGRPDRRLTVWDISDRDTGLKIPIPKATTRREAVNGAVRLYFEAGKEQIVTLLGEANRHLFSLRKTKQNEEPI